MTTIQDLPNLVIIRILKKLIDVDDTFRYIPLYLKYLAICRQWRYLALPLLHKLLIIVDAYDSPVFNNIPLIVGSGCMEMVQSLNIECERENGFKDAIEPLMNLMGMDKISWPKNFKDNLVNDYNNEPETSLNGLVVPKLNDEMFEKMTIVIENFMATFPNINSIRFVIPHPCGITTQFTTKLIRAYFDQLKRLHCKTSAPLDMPSFPPNLTHLVYECKPRLYLPAPKVNTYPLKALMLDEVPLNFAWQQNCSSLVFPKLKRLVIHYSSPDGYTSLRRQSTHQYAPLELLEAKHINIVCRENIALNFAIKKISPHLDFFRYTGCFKNLKRFSKLPIESIKDIKLSIGGEAITDSLDFYSITNKMLAKSSDTSQMIEFSCRNLDMNIDIQKINVKTVSALSTGLITNNLLIKLVIEIPRLKRLSVGTMGYIGEEDIDWNLLVSSKIQQLSFYAFQYEGSSKRMTDFMVKLVKSLTHLTKIFVPGGIDSDFMDKLKSAQNEHEHLRELLIY